MLSLILTVGMMLAGAPIPPCDADCVRHEVNRLINEGDVRSAVDRLKTARAQDPDDRSLILLLARAYLLQDNLFWAERTLDEGLGRWPSDPDLLTWMAVVHLRQGDPELAADDLDPGLEPAEDPLRARWRLLDASRAHLEGDDDRASFLVELIDGSDVVFPEDVAPLATLHANLDPWWGPVFSGTIDLGGGHTSNALAGSPTDPGTGGPSSGLAMPELRARLAPDTRGRLKPVIDFELLGNFLLEEEARDLSTVLGGVRFGAMTTTGERRLTFGYRAEGLHLEEKSGLYSEAHRAEAEIEWIAGRVLFAGVGHRSYTDERRTRWEGDLGLGGSLGRIGRTPLVAGATLRLADAESKAYDQFGLSAAASSTFPLGRRLSLRVAGSVIWDDYFNSGGDEGLEVFGTEDKRRDLLGRIGLTLWGPQWRNLRPGLEVRATRRDSTADDRPGYDFSFSEWRAVFWLRWTFAAGNGAPKVSEPLGHVPLDWGIDAADGRMEQDRILDLLRRDEELRRGSSCSIVP